MVRGGVIVLEGGAKLPEGTVVEILAHFPNPENQKRTVFPLVRSAEPGSLPLTNEMVNRILDDEDVAHYLDVMKRAAKDTVEKK